MGTLYEQLETYGKSDYYGFHMPGHKRNTERFGSGLPYGIDITEIDGFDDLHHAGGILKAAEKRASRLYQSGETHFLVNGSTVGILSAILGTTNRGDRILMARNCHKSVYHAVFLNELEPVYVYPKYEREFEINGEVTVESVEEALRMHPEVKAVMIVSPTYDGVLSDVEKIANVVHGYQIPLIVDEAHGAHFGFHEDLPHNSNTKGADIVIHSVHKTLPAMTQTALIHLNGNLVNRERVNLYLHMLQSSSPSYVLMASIDSCMEQLEKNGRKLFEQYIQKIQNLREELRKLKYLRVVETEHFDPSKFIISVKDADMTSRELNRILLETYHLQMEMTGGSYVLAMTSIGDTAEGLERLAQALFEIDGMLREKKQESVELELPRLPQAYTCARTLREAVGDGRAYVDWQEAEGKIAAEYAYIYPPGIPFVVPGERITKEAVDYLEKYQRLGFTIEGIHEDKQIGVWING